jgi:hypothetical protein
VVHVAKAIVRVATAAAETPVPVVADLARRALTENAPLARRVTENALLARRVTENALLAHRAKVPMPQAVVDLALKVARVLHAEMASAVPAVASSALADPLPQLLQRFTATLCWPPYPPSSFP